MMEPLTAQDTIALWERGRQASKHDRALLMHAFARPQLDPAAAAELPVGRRDAALAELRRACFGARAPAYLECPHCSEGMEFEVDLDALLTLAPAARAEPFELHREPFWLRARLPSTADLQAAAGEAGAEAARRVLIERCVLEATRAGDHIDAAGLPADLTSALEAEIERLDPLSDIRFAQSCPACSERFVAPFDVAAYLWQELDVDARRLVQEVDALARIYGWSEAEILAMSRIRRLTYLEVCGVL